MGYNTTFIGNFDLTGKEDVLAGLLPMINNFSEKRHHAVGNTNEHHPDMPKGFWCDWNAGSTISSKNADYFLFHNQSDKSYNQAEWLKYLIKHFFEPNEVLVNGKVEWAGEDPNDRGMIVVENNIVKIFKAQITYVEDKSS